MSTNPNPPAPLTAEQAQNFLVDQIELPVFFQKLASDFGIKPRNQEEASELITLGGKLRSIYDMQQAQAGPTSLLKQAHANVDEQLAKLGLAQQGSSPIVKAAAQELSGNSKIAHAILSLRKLEQGAAVAA